MPLRIIIVADDPNVAQTAHQQLSNIDEQIELVEVNNLNLVRRALATRTFDLVICALSFGLFSAKDVMLIVNVFDLHLPFILMVNDNQEAAAIEAMNQGATDFVFLSAPARLMPAVKRELSQLKLKREKIKAINHLNHLAYHDSLTGLYNRFRIEEILGSAIDFAHRSNIVLARDYLLYIDLDQFKVINDVCGHVVGDQVIKEIGGLIAEHLPSGGKAAHVNADVFAIFAHNSDEKRVKQLA